MGAFGLVMLTLVGAFLLVILLIVGWLRVDSKRKEFLRHYDFPPHVQQALLRKHPHLVPDDVEKVCDALRDYFSIYWARRGRAFVAMPSRVVDDLWHEFILDTRAYAEFCKNAFGKFLHHQPAGSHYVDEKAYRVGLALAWFDACTKENLRPRASQSMPRLFGIDAALGILGGMHYTFHQMRAVYDEHEHDIHPDEKVHYIPDFINHSSGGDADGCSDGSCRDPSSGCGNGCGAGGDGGDGGAGTGGCGSGCGGGCGGGGGD